MFFIYLICKIKLLFIIFNSLSLYNYLNLYNYRYNIN